MYITRLEIRININNNLHPSIVQVDDHLTISYHQYYKLKMNAQNLREYWL